MKTYFLSAVIFLTIAHSISAQTMADKNFSFNKPDKDKFQKLSFAQTGSPGNIKTRLPKFTFGINPYLWIQSIRGTFTLPINQPGLPSKTPEAKISLKFSDAMKYLKYGGIFSGDFQFKSIGIFYEIDYVKFRYPAYVPENSGYKDASVNSTLLSGDINIAYNIKLRRQRVSNAIFAGARIWSADNTLDFTEKVHPPLTASYSKTWVDPIAGAYTLYEFSEKWFTYIKVEVGGYGVSSKISYLLQGSIVMRVSNHLNAIAGLKFLGVNYDRDNFIWKVAQSGLLLSLGYRY